METRSNGRGVYLLPFGYVDQAGKVHKEVELREMTGVEEDILASLKVPPRRRIERILTNCIERIGDYTDKQAIERILQELCQSDRATLLVWLRCLSLDPVYEFETSCPRCDEKNKVKVELDKLDIAQAKDPTRKVHEVALPSGKTAKMKVLLGKDEPQRDLLVEKSKDEILSVNILVRLVELDGRPPSKDAVKSLSWKDRNFLRNFIDEIEGGIETDVSWKCRTCESEFTIMVDIGQRGFLFPKEEKEATA